jgi:diguanylate cyclase (GGDEF)-like protein
VLVGLVALAGSAAIASSLALAIDGSTAYGANPSWAVVGTLAVLVAVGDLLAVDMRVRSTIHGMAWADAAVLIALAVAPVPWVVLLTAAGIAVATAFRRLSLLKYTFAVAKESVTALAGGVVLLALGSTPSPESPASLPALAVAFAVMVVLDPLMTVPVIALASRTRVVDRFRANWDVRLVTAVARFGVAAIAVTALQVRQELLYGLPLVVLLIYMWHERWVRAREERQAWQNLAAATESFSGVDLDVVLHAAVTRGAKLFSADQLEVEVWQGASRRLVRGADEITYDGDPERAPTDGANVYAVALQGYPGRRDIGALRLRFRNRIKISDRERAMLGTFAAALDTAVRNAAAYGKLGEATEAHAYAAAHDALTGLANRRALERRLEDALTDHEPVALLLLDLKHFKEVNDTLGHLAGDWVLVQVARRLTDAAGPDALVTRFGGDEFAILLPEAVSARSEDILEEFAEPVEVDGLPIVVEANAGLALAIDPQDEPEEPGIPAPPFRDHPQAWMAELMRRADVAMYQAKRMGQPLVSYAMAGDPADRDRLSLAGQLPRAVSEREFVVHFQPIVELATGDVLGAEALARWRHPTRGQLDPRWFLDLLERSAQLPAFTAAVLDDALTAANTWRAAGHDLRVSVNISARSLLDTNLPRQVLQALDRHHTQPDRLCLELTETLALSQLETVDQVLTQLYDIGVQLALDDFGTGFSSLAVLSRIPVHQLKIDRSFVDKLREPDPDLEEVAQARAVIRTTVQLGRTLDLTVVAEGIENTRQRRLLWELGCTAGQGHLFARAKPAERLLAELTEGAGALALPLPGEANVVLLPRPRREKAPESQDTR